METTFFIDDECAAGRKSSLWDEDVVSLADLTMWPEVGEEVEVVLLLGCEGFESECGIARDR